MTATMNSYRRRRQVVIDYMGGKCVLCGAIADLDFDHIDRSAKSFEIAKNLTLNDRLKDELKKCQLLCRPHHREKTARENMGITHGKKFGWMKSGCRCAECLAARAAFNRARQAARGLRRTGYGRDSDHGERITYQRGCRCTECKAGNAEYSRRLYAARATG